MWNGHVIVVFCTVLVQMNSVDSLLALNRLRFNRILPSMPSRENIGTSNFQWPTFRDNNLSNFRKAFEELDKEPTVEEKRISRPQLILARLLSFILRRVVRANTQLVTGLDVDIGANSNRDIALGKIDSLHLKFDKIAFNQLFVSGGGKIVAKGIDLRMRRLFFQRRQAIRKPYMMYADLLLTQMDIINSKFIRNLMQLLVNTILDRVFSQVSKVLNAPIMSCEITKVSIRNRRVFARGVAKIGEDDLKAPGLRKAAMSSPSIGGGVVAVPFEVSTGAAVRDEGQRLFLRDIQVVLNPDSLLRTTMPILTTAPIDVDLGDDFRIESLVIAETKIWVRAAAVISPVSRFDVAPVKSTALYRYDLAALLSSVLKLQGGFATRWMESA